MSSSRFSRMSRREVLLVVVPLMLLASSTAATKIVMKTACKGDTLEMRCLQNQHILVTTLQMGESNKTCHRVSRVTQTVPTYTNNEESLQNIKDKCDYKKICSISHEDLVGDCVHNTYFDVEFMCCRTSRTSTFSYYSAFASKHQHVPPFINCTNNNGIRIIDAEYGRGPTKNKNTRIISIEGKRDITMELANTCDGHKTCQMPSDIFSSTGKYAKYLEVRYVCPFP